jgi:thiamine-monophosphate kinase
MEFDLINQFFAPLCRPLHKSDKGIGDDAALMTPKSGYQVVTTMDTMVEDVHFVKGAEPYHLGWKLLMVNLSDLAAMGAEPWAYSLAITLPESLAHDVSWLQAFAQGLTKANQTLANPIPLIGGDTTRGPLTLTINLQGQVKQGQAILRAGAQAGDKLVVTGTIGDGALGLAVLLGHEGLSLNETQSKGVLRKLHCPLARSNVASFMYGAVSSALDISDGLLQDLSHLLQGGSLSSQDRLGAHLYLERIPLSSAMKQYFQVSGDYSKILSGGDDYELLMSVPEENWQVFQQRCQSIGQPVYEIGEVVSNPEIRIYENGLLRRDLNELSGFKHFK